MPDTFTTSSRFFNFAVTIWWRSQTGGKGAGGGHPRGGRLPLANVVAAIQVPRSKCERLGPDAKVVTLMADSGLKYLSTDVYRRRGQFYLSWVTGSRPGDW
jgi:hypothetical protein